MEQIKEEKPKLTPEEEYALICNDLGKTIRILILKQLQFKIMNGDEFNMNGGTIEEDFLYLKKILEIDN